MHWRIFYHISMTMEKYHSLLSLTELIQAMSALGFGFNLASPRALGSTTAGRERLCKTALTPDQFLIMLTYNIVVNVPPDSRPNKLFVRR